MRTNSQVLLKYCCFVKFHRMYLRVSLLNYLIYCCFGLLLEFLAPWYIKSTAKERLLQQKFEATMPIFDEYVPKLQHFSTFETLCNVRGIG